MKTQFKTFPGALVGHDDTEMWLEHFISTETQDSGGDIMRAAGMKLRGKPVVLFQHGLDPKFGNEPIARVLDIRVGEFNGKKGLIAKTKYFDGSILTPPDATGQRLYLKAKDGTMPNWSIGFNSIKEHPVAGGGRVVDEWELHEYSQVAVGMNAEATTLATSAPELKFIIKADAEKGGLGSGRYPAGSGKDGDALPKDTPAGTPVRFKEPKEPGDAAARFAVVEDRGDRVLVKDENSKEPIPPTFVYGKEELVIDKPGKENTETSSGLSNGYEKTNAAIDKSNEALKTGSPDDHRQAMDLHRESAANHKERLGQGDKEDDSDHFDAAGLHNQAANAHEKLIDDPKDADAKETVDKVNVELMPYLKNNMKTAMPAETKAEPLTSTKRAHKAIKAMHKEMMSDLKAHGSRDNLMDVGAEKCAKEALEEFTDGAHPHVVKYIKAVRDMKDDVGLTDDGDEGNGDGEEKGYRASMNNLTKALRGMVKSIHGLRGNQAAVPDHEAEKCLTEHSKTAEPHAVEFIKAWHEKCKTDAELERETKPTPDKPAASVPADDAENQKFFINKPPVSIVRLKEDVPPPSLKLSLKSDVKKPAPTITPALVKELIASAQASMSDIMRAELRKAAGKVS